MNKRLFLFAPVLYFISCSSGSADNKVPELADQMCSCFDTYGQNITSEEMTIFKAVSFAANPQEELRNSLQKMDTAKARAFTEKIKLAGDKNSDVYACLQRFDKKHEKETTKNKKALTEKLLAQLQVNNCVIGAAMVNLSLKRGSKKMTSEK